MINKDIKEEEPSIEPSIEPSFSCMEIPYDDSFEYTAIMHIIREYYQKYPTHHIKDVAICDVSKGSHNNLFKLFWDNKHHHKHKYKLRFSIENKYKSFLQSFLRSHDIIIKEIK